MPQSVAQDLEQQLYAEVMRQVQDDPGHQS
jgi:hypothetical protein